MTEENFILVSLDDSKSKEIAEVLGSETCKKIINYLAQNKEASQMDLANNLKIPINTVDYNVKKLLSSGFIQKRSNFFWSAKGKKIVMYEISNKSIVISHKKPNKDKIKSIIPAVLLTAAGTFAIGVYEKIAGLSKNIVQSTPNYYGGAETVMTKAADVAGSTSIMVAERSSIFLSPQPFPAWGWFLGGAVLVIVIPSIVNWRKL